jgi:RND family efflux transporter MFP subunit
MSEAVESHARTRPRRTAWLVVAAIAALAAAPACSHVTATDANDANRAHAPLPAVAVVRVARGPLSRTLVMTAELRPFQEIDVHAKVAGFVRQFSVDVGDRVHAGDPLATLEIPELADEAQQADAGVGASESEIERATSEVTRASSAHDVAHVSATRLAAVAKSQPGLVAQQEIDEAAGRDKVAEAQLATATASLAASKQQLAVARANQARQHALLDYARITAPFAGVITKRYADTGAMIQAGTSSTTQALPLVRLSETDRLRLVIPVPESAVPNTRPGSAVTIRVPAINRTFAGQVARVADQVDPVTRTMHAEVDVPNENGGLVPGMYAEVTLVLERLTDALVVPVQALDRSDSGISVMRVGEGNVLERRPVTIGIETADAAAATDGLRDGDVVVVGPRSQLRVGERVDPRVTSTSATSASAPAPGGGR